MKFLCRENLIAQTEREGQDQMRTGIRDNATAVRASKHEKIDLSDLKLFSYFLTFFVLFFCFLFVYYE